MTMGLQGYGQPQDWQDDMYYPVGQTVVDRGGIWRAVAANRNSEPISGNADWTLVAGTPYVDVTLTPVDLTTAPFMDNGTGPGLEVIPAPSASQQICVTKILGTVSDGDPSDSSFLTVKFSYTDAFTSANPGLDRGLTSVDFPNGQDLSFVSSTTGWVSGGGSQAPNPGLGQKIVMWTETGLGTPSGSRSLRVRTFYTFLPPPPDTATFFTITAVDQGTQTFTVNGDATGDIAAGDSVSVVGSTLNNGDYTVTSATATSALDITAVDTVGKKFTVAGDQTPFFVATDSAVVAGSTGNDGTFTVVSATFVAGTHTDIVVVEVILDATVDGTIEDQTTRTAIITVGAIPDSTADGWVEVA